LGGRVGHGGKKQEGWTWKIGRLTKIRPWLANKERLRRTGTCSCCSMHVGKSDDGEACVENHTTGRGPFRLLGTKAPDLGVWGFLDIARG
jgi:hypothetical protein